MQVGVPLGNWVCYVFNEYIFLVEYQLKTSYASQIQDSRLEFISVLPRLV